ncbi:hypothetical protein AWC38_SpisGene15263 [Stylophora pistillata]|uniref:Uncharacterized protein n=1 Tax=Stylophora pistillata TaxID=50429 RepID=A0A2B4RVD7_STYPI|nr:hypothetical protein AWC38_SpisGene15263 [Stylophora pistillata]
MAKANVRSEQRIYIEFPTETDHAHHLMGEGSSLSQPVDDRIIRQIEKLVNEGVKGTHEMRTHLTVYIKNEILAEDEIQPSPSNHNVAEKVIQWKASSPEDFIYFQPCGDVSSATTDGEDHTTEQDPSTLLFVHQSAWQHRLLKRYSNMCLLDATYKTTHYALPLFFLVVHTNGDYQDDASVAKLSQFSIRGWKSNMEHLPPAGLFKAY